MRGEMRRAERRSEEKRRRTRGEERRGEEQGAPVRRADRVGRPRWSKQVGFCGAGGRRRRGSNVVSTSALPRTAWPRGPPSVQHIISKAEECSCWAWWRSGSSTAHPQPKR